MGKKVNDFILCFSSSFAFSEVANVSNRTTEHYIIEINKFVKRALDVAG